MPQYHYQCKKCGTEINVIRSFDKYEEHPNAEDGDIKACDSEDHDWERLIGGSQILQRGPSWRGAKGHW